MTHQQEISKTLSSSEYSLKIVDVCFWEDNVYFGGDNVYFWGIYVYFGGIQRLWVNTKIFVFFLEFLFFVAGWVLGLCGSGGTIRFPKISKV